MVYLAGMSGRFVCGISVGEGGQYTDMGPFCWSCDGIYMYRVRVDIHRGIIPTAYSD